MIDPNKDLTTRRMLVSIAIIVAIITAIAVFDDHSGVSPRRELAKAVKCRDNLQCWGAENISQAEACKVPIERLTQTDFKWTDKVFESKFSVFRWHKEAAFTLTYSGDKLLVQNEHGAYIRLKYECDFDPIGQTALGVRMSPGRLD